MTAYVALLRAVNVGGTGKLPMSELKAQCEALGFSNVRTYIASGNVVFHAQASADAIKAALAAALHDYAGKPVGVVVRTAAEMAAVLDANPFAREAPNRTVAIFLDKAPPEDLIESISGRNDEKVAPGKREIYVHYGQGMANSKLKIPAARDGTARNINTIATLAQWAAQT
ncbi:DUF1697 domain-containing protein [Bordetella sp. FB-8]|uniref:DUF1697 domain-containing protein n=1 Tax=Bordetella sp. FB-8 TaxID=1159870 RepID=UPI000360C386|nr:DUF1697 domain-containing protein [Bordetella sp. FB-8]